MGKQNAATMQNALSNYWHSLKTEKNTQIKSLMGFWAASITSGIAYGFIVKRHLPIQFKLIHARVIAQGATVGVLVVGADLAMMSDYNKASAAHTEKKTLKE